MVYIVWTHLNEIPFWADLELGLVRETTSLESSGKVSGSSVRRRTPAGQLSRWFFFIWLSPGDWFLLLFHGYELEFSKSLSLLFMNTLNLKIKFFKKIKLVWSLELVWMICLDSDVILQLVSLESPYLWASLYLNKSFWWIGFLISILWGPSFGEYFV